VRPELPDPLTFPALLARNRAVAADEPVLVTEDGRLTHAELDARSRELARVLVADGVGKGARVGVVLPNGLDWALVAAAVTRVGGVLVPLSTLLRPPELEAQLTVAAVTHLVVTDGFRGRSTAADMEAIAPGIETCLSAGRRDARLPLLRRLWVAGAWPAAAASDGLVAALEQAVGPADDFVVLFTSGSRGAPKGTIHTHGSALRATSASLDARCVGRGERLYIPMPFFWTGGFSQGLLAVLLAAATLITEAVPEPERTLRLIEKERVSLFRGWPEQAARLAAHPAFDTADLAELRPASLPAVLPADLRPRPGARPVLFGMTETNGPWCGDRLDADLPDPAHGSCGRPFAGVELRVVDPDTGAECGVGELGELRLRGPNLMRAMCGRTRDQVFDADGFYPTGDLGTVDADGYVRFRGRRDDMFKVSGATVYPSEVEEALRAVDGVVAAHVTNVANPDCGRDLVGALVVTVAERQEIIAAARARLSAFKVPTVWVLTPDPAAVPVTATSKVDKAALQGLLTRTVAQEQRSEEP
jgi:acyl-CoA synthetase (AMP-forming)/AMP-acid ligase II